MQTHAYGSNPMIPTHFTNAVRRHLDTAFHDCCDHLIWVCLTSSFGAILKCLNYEPLWKQNRISKLELQQYVKLFRTCQGPLTRCARTWRITIVLAMRLVGANANSFCKLTENNTTKNSEHMYKQQTNCC